VAGRTKPAKQAFADIRKDYGLWYTKYPLPNRQRWI
jgi:hypothetical protein